MREFSFAKYRYRKITPFICFISLLLLFCLLPIPFLQGGFIRDDDFFYLKVAENFSRGFGSTFDQVQTTNGYHPLWMLCLSMLFFILDRLGLSSPEVHFRTSLFLSLIIITTTLLLGFRIIKRLSRRNPSKQSKILVLIYMITFPFSISLLSDGILVTFLITLILHEYAHKRYNLVFLMIPLVFLTRIDLLPLAVFFCVYTLFNDFKEGIKSILLLLLTVGIYIFSNYHYFGHFITVSSYVKTQKLYKVGLLGNAKNQLFNLTGRMGVLNTFYFVSIVFYLFNKHQVNCLKSNKRAYNLLFLMATGGFLYIWSMLFFNAGLRDWYFIWPLYLIGLFLFTSIEVFKQTIPAVSLFKVNINQNKVVYTFTIFLILSAASAILYYGKRNWYDHHYHYAVWLKEYIPEEEPMLQLDIAGTISFFSGRRVISADGLVCSFDYVKKFHDKKLHIFLKENNIKYLGVHEDQRKKLIKDDNEIKYSGSIFAVTHLRNFKDEYHLYAINMY